MGKRFGLVGLLFLCIALITGCGGDGLNRVDIEGMLTADGSPVDGATVQFIPADSTESPGAIGTTDSSGKFTVTSSRDDASGIPPGKYKVRVTRLTKADGSVLPADATEADHPDARESIPAPYSTMDSPLEATVPETGGEVKLEIPKPLVGKGK